MPVFVLTWNIHTGSLSLQPKHSINGIRPSLQEMHNPLFSSEYPVNTLCSSVSVPVDLKEVHICVCPRFLISSLPHHHELQMRTRNRASSKLPPHKFVVLPF